MLKRDKQNCDKLPLSTAALLTQTYVCVHDKCCKITSIMSHTLEKFLRIVSMPIPYIHMGIHSCDICHSISELGVHKSPQAEGNSLLIPHCTICVQ